MVSDKSSPSFYGNSFVSITFSTRLVIFRSHTEGLLWPDRIFFFNTSQRFLKDLEQELLMRNLDD